MPGWVRRALIAGAIAGAAAVYLVTVGLIGAFQNRPAVTDVVSIGTLMLAVCPFVAGIYLGNRFSRAGAGAARILAAAAAAGITAGLIAAVFAALVATVDVGGVFLAINQRIIDFITFDAGPAMGGALLVALATASAVLGAGLFLLQAPERSAILAGLATAIVLSILEPLLRPILGRMELTAIDRFLYQGGGLTLMGGVVAFVAAALLSSAWNRAGADYRRAFRDMPREQRRPVGAGLLVLAFVIVLVLPQVTGGFVSLVLVQVGFFLLLALGLNIVVGYAGLLDLGYVAFYAVGAYTTAVLLSPTSVLDGVFTQTFGGLAFWMALPVVMIMAGIVGILIGAPVLRLRGDYLAIVTLGFGEIARILFLSDALEPWVGGAQGIVRIPDLNFVKIDFSDFELWGPLTEPIHFFYPILIFCGLAAFVAWRLANSRTGRAWNAMREDEQVAEATGVNTTNYKLLAFALGATLGCLGGSLFAVQLGSVFPATFNILVSITTLAIIILGGMGNIPGVVLGALLLIGLPELLREFEQYRLLIYGAVLIGMMILRPEGLFPSRIRREELHEVTEEEEREQLAAVEGELELAAGPVITRGPLPD